MRAPAGTTPVDFFADDTPEPVTGGELAQISMLAEQQLHYEREVEELKEQLKEANRKLKDIAEKALPEAMLAVGMSEFKLDIGFKITIKEEVFASIKADSMSGAIDWFDSHALGDVVKDQVTVSLGKGESALATQFLELAEQIGVPANEKFSVHAGTLKSLVKEQLALGVEFPEEFFSVYPFKKSIIKPYKEKASRKTILAPIAPPVVPVDLNFNEF